MIAFKQSKTENLVCLPITTFVGNALAKYILEEQPNVESKFFFLEHLQHLPHFLIMLHIMPL